MKLKLPRRRIWRVAIYAFSTLLIVLAIDLIVVQLGRRIPYDFETTRITEPTLPNGSIDYLAALESHYSQGVTPDNNAMVPLLTALGPRALPPIADRDAYTKRLGMSPLAENGDYFQSREKFASDGLANGMETDHISPLLAKPWKASEHPHSAEWLKANEKQLARIIEATRRTRFFFPGYGNERPETLAGVLLTYLPITRHAADALVSRAMLRAGEGDLAGAHDDLEAAHRLAALLSQGVALVDRLVAYAIDVRASQAEQTIAAANLLDAAQAKQWLAVTAGRAQLNSLADGIDFAERFLFLDILQFAADHGLNRIWQMVSNGPPAQFGAIWNVVPMRFARAMRVGNVWYDRLVSACNLPTRAQRRDAAATLMKEFDAARRNDSAMRLGRGSDWPIVIFLPGLGKVIERDDRAFTHRALAQAALTLAAYHAELGTFPQELTNVPPDPFSDAPLIYHVTAKGYVLYSAGPNGTDEQGNGDDIPVAARPDGSVGLDALNL